MLRIYLAAMNLQQKDVAEEIGISESTLSRFLSGQQMPDAAGFMKIIGWCSFSPLNWKKEESK